MNAASILHSTMADVGLRYNSLPDATIAQWTLIDQINWQTRRHRSIEPMEHKFDLNDITASRPVLSTYTCAGQPDVPLPRQTSCVPYPYNFQIGNDLDLDSWTRTIAAASMMRIK